MRAHARAHTHTYSMSQVTVQYLKYIYLQYISIFSIFSSTIFEICLKLASNKKQDTRPGLFFKVFTVTFDKVQKVIKPKAGMRKHVAENYLDHHSSSRY